MQTQEVWGWLESGLVLWWLFAGMVGLLALAAIIINLRLWSRQDPPED